MAARPSSDESTLGGSRTTGAASAAGGGGGGAPAPDPGRAGNEANVSGSNTDTPGTDSDISRIDTGTLEAATGAPTIRGGTTPGVTPAGVEACLAMWGATARPVGAPRYLAADDDAAGDVGAGTDAVAVAGTVTAAASAPDAGVAGGSLLVGSTVRVRRGAAGVTREAAGAADIGAAPATCGIAAASVTDGRDATAARAPDALTIAAAPSMALWAVDRPTWATEPGDTLTLACATWGSARAIRTITIPNASGAPPGGRPRLIIA